MRRCSWCGVELRWWQLNNCRVCAFSLRFNTPSPPCAQASRWNARPDRFSKWEPPRFALSASSGEQR